MTKRVGLLGCGRWGQHILRDLIECGVDVHVCSRGEASLAEARRRGARTEGSDWSVLDGMDGYVVATPTITHADMIERLLDTGRPIFVEKPMTADVISARRIAEAVPERVFVMDKWRYHPGIEAIRSRIAAGTLGKILSIKSYRWGWSNPHDDVSALWILAPHDLSIVLHLIGAIPPVMEAWPTSFFDPGMGLSALLGGGDLPTVTLDIGIASPSHTRRCLVIGELGTAELRDGYDDRVFFREGAPGALGALESEHEVGRAMPLRAEIKSFVDFLSGGPPPMSSAAEGLLIVERLAEIEAAMARRLVQLPQ